MGYRRRRGMWGRSVRNMLLALATKDGYLDWAVSWEIKRGP
jgi:hypothetical protein